MGETDAKDLNIEKRLEILDEIKSFCDSSENKLTSVLQSLNWDTKYIENELSRRNMCPYDNSHLIGPAKMEEHILTCKHSQFYFNHHDKLLSENFNNDETNPSVVIDEIKSASIIAEASRKNCNFTTKIQKNSVDNRPAPLSLNQMKTLFTVDERRALYDYVISQKPNNNLNHMDLSLLNIYASTNESSSSLPKSSLEELAMIRDMKRRRAKYKVSTKSKSYVEVMRNVIDNLMLSHEEDVRENLHFKHKKYKKKSRN